MSIHGETGVKEGGDSQDVVHSGAGSGGNSSGGGNG